jgi:hypothetical protein
MAGAFDRLQKQIDEQRKHNGISVLDLADLPPALRKIMRLMLRQTRLTCWQQTSNFLKGSVWRAPTWTKH